MFESSLGHDRSSRDVNKLLFCYCFSVTALTQRSYTMALRMPGPIAIAPTYVFHLNVRVPADLRDTMRGRFVSLPVAGKDVTVKVGDKVIASLPTKEAGEAKRRFTAALAVSSSAAGLNVYACNTSRMMRNAVDTGRQGLRRVAAPAYRSASGRTFRPRTRRASA